MKKQENYQQYKTEFFFKTKIKYATIPKEYLKDKTLSLKAKGLLTIMYTLPEEWNFSINGLMVLTGIGKKQITNTLKEIIESGYIIRTETREKGRFKFIYYIHYEKIENLI